VISTPRLTLLPLTQEQLNLFVHGIDQLEPTLGLRPSLREEIEPLLGVLVYFTMPRLRDPVKYPPLFNTLWIAIDNHRQQIVASAKFKGAPDETGTIEIGYGTYPVFQRRGYMTEMVQGMIDWASQQPDVRRIVADTDIKNVASQKVLEKCGFRLFDRVEEMLWFELEIIN
jgi:[ribosomal protein S5]-alanine N-acetyltransferase